MLTAFSQSKYLNAEVGREILEACEACGVGKLADVHSLQVLGLDLVNIQPEKYGIRVRSFASTSRANLFFLPTFRRIPPNLRFRIPRDYESPWSLGEDSWDLIHLRMACGSVSSWPELYQKIYTYVEQPLRKKTIEFFFPSPFCKTLTIKTLTIFFFLLFTRQTP